MDNMSFFELYSHLPEHINPIAFSLVNFSIRWYALMYIAAFLAVYLLLRYRIRKREDIYSKKIVEEFLIFALAGLLIGGRLGYVFLYNFSYFWENILAIIYPFDLKTGEFIGIFGMSYFGGLLGVLAASGIFVIKNKINFWKFSDFVIPAVPAGYFFGRLGNFFNGELYGKITDKPWGMYVKGELRHPSQLYEAFLEGMFLFIILWLLRNNKKYKGKLLWLYLIGYGLARFISEFFRAEPEQLLNQSLSAGMIILGSIFLTRKK